MDALARPGAGGGSLQSAAAPAAAPADAPMPRPSLALPSSLGSPSWTVVAPPPPPPPPPPQPPPAVDLATAAHVALAHLSLGIEAKARTPPRWVRDVFHFDKGEGECTKALLRHIELYALPDTHAEFEEDRAVPFAMFADPWVTFRKPDSTEWWEIYDLRRPYIQRCRHYATLRVAHELLRRRCAALLEGSTGSVDRALVAAGAPETAPRKLRSSMDLHMCSVGVGGAVGGGGGRRLDVDAIELSTDVDVAFGGVTITADIAWRTAVCAFPRQSPAVEQARRLRAAHREFFEFIDQIRYANWLANWMDAILKTGIPFESRIETLAKEPQPIFVTGGAPQSDAACNRALARCR